jgi:hypothetical protein
MPNVPIMPLIALVLVLLPIRLSALQMKGLAFLLWFTGGMVLAFRGTMFLFSDTNPPSQVIVAVVVLVALAIGYGKGKFVLSKTSRKNIERIDAFTEPKRPIQVYSLRSWIIIALMVLISVSLNLFHVSGLIRGAVNLGIGMGLIVSSLAYVKALTSSTKPPAIPS